MNVRTKLSFTCYAAYASAFAYIGLMFLSRTEFVPMHAAIAAMSWHDVPPSLQILIATMMKALGGLYLAIANGVMMILTGPFRRGERWGMLSVAALAAVGLLGPVSAMIYMQMQTAASPPWGVPLTLTALVIAGAALSLPRQREADQGAIG